jgi:FkbM family methyltransferase
VDCDLIYDVGMYDGGDTASYLSKGYRVVAVEVNPQLVEVAERRFARDIAAGQLTIINVGVAEDWGKETLWVAEENLEWSSLDRGELLRRGVEPRAMEVECRPFSSILEEHGVPFYLKVDIEGNDYRVIASLDPCNLPQYCSVELPRNSGVSMIFAAMATGFTEFKIIAQRDFSALEFRPHEIGPTVRRLIPARLRPLDALEYRRHELTKVLRRRLTRATTARDYPSGTSGPFGEATPGGWMDADEALFTWLAYRLGHTRLPHGRTRGVWHDLHCRR